MRVNCINQNSSVCHLALKPIKNNQKNITNISDKSKCYNNSLKNGIGNLWKCLKNQIKNQWEFFKSEFSIKKEN